MVWIGRGIEIGLVTAYTGCRGTHLSNPLCGNLAQATVVCEPVNGKVVVVLWLNVALVHTVTS